MEACYYSLEGPAGGASTRRPIREVQQAALSVIEGGQHDYHFVLSCGSSLATVKNNNIILLTCI